MNPADQPPDDSYWSSLAEELEVSKPAAPPPAAAPAADDHPHLADEPDGEEDTMVEIDLSQEPMTDEPAADGDAPADGDPSRKKRRRRRRRRKGGDAPAGEDKPAAATDTADADEADDADEPEDEAFGEQGGGVTPAAAEEPPAELAREVIANWDVPSWEEIVTGLYRPSGGGR